MKKYILTFVFVVSAFYFNGATVISAKVVTDDVTEPTVWTLEESPYIIHHPINITSSGSLTISPGVMIDFQGGYILAYGKVSMEGEENRKVRLKGSQYDSSGFYFYEGSDPVLRNFVTDGLGGGLFFDSVTATIENGFMENNRYAFNIQNSYLTMRDVVATSTLYDVLGGGNSEVHISFTTFSGSLYGRGVSLDNTSTLFMDTTKIVGVNGDGILLVNSKSTISSSRIQGSLGNGIFLKGSSLTLSSTTLSQNTIGLNVARNGGVNPNFSGGDLAIGVTPAGSMAIIQSRIYDNSEYNILNNGNTTVEAQLNWWGKSESPESTIFGSVVFDPWLTKDPEESMPISVCCSNVLFLPGLEASRLYTKGMIFENKLWEPNRNADVEKLYLDANGNSLNSGIYTRDIIDEAFGFNIYKKFGESLDTLVKNKVMNAWEAYPYDWRFSPDSNTKLLDKVIAMASTSMNGKVTLITHSNGGLIGKWLVGELQKQGKANLVDKLILVAVPQIGTVQAIPAILHGYDQDLLAGLILNESVARELGKNMSSAYNLLPSKNYFDLITDPVIQIDKSTQTLNNLYTMYGSVIGTQSKMEDFLLAKVDRRTQPESTDTDTPLIVNKKLLDKAKAFHEIFDVWQKPEGLKVIQIAGVGLDTMKGMKYVKKYVDLDHEPVFTYEGDGTVVSPSATYMNADTYYIDIAKHNRELLGLRRNRSHKDILEIKSVQDFISALVQDKEEVPAELTKAKPIVSNDDKRIHISMHSPITLDVYDSFGNHTGVKASSTSDFTFVDEEIPNSSYRAFGEGQYLGLDSKDRYEIKGSGTGTGVFTLITEQLSGGSVVASSSFVDIPVTPLTSISLVVNQTSNATSSLVLNVDSDGDGAVDFKVLPNKQFDPVLYLQSMKKVIATLGLKPKVQDEIFMKIDRLVVQIQKGKMKNVESVVKKYATSLKQQKGHFRHNRKIDADDKKEIINMLNTLLDALKTTL